MQPPFVQEAANPTAGLCFGSVFSSRPVCAQRWSLSPAPIHHLEAVILHLHCRDRARNLACSGKVVLLLWASCTVPVLTHKPDTRDSIRLKTNRPRIVQHSLYSSVVLLFLSLDPAPGPVPRALVSHGKTSPRNVNFWAFKGCTVYSADSSISMLCPGLIWVLCFKEQGPVSHCWYFLFIEKLELKTSCNIPWLSFLAGPLPCSWSCVNFKSWHNVLERGWAEALQLDRTSLLTVSWLKQIYNCTVPIVQSGRAVPC